MQVSSSDNNDTIGDNPASEVPAFLGLTQQQSALLVALYNETDPEFAKQIPTALPVAAQQLASEFEKRNSVGKKLERAGTEFLEEYKVFESTQQEAVERLSKTEMNIDKAAEGIELGESASIKDLLLASFLYGGVRHEPINKDDRASMSPVASPNFEGAKTLLERAFEKGFTMAAVQIGSFYVQEQRLAEGKNLKDQDPKKLAYEWYTKAASKGNPMAIHKVAFFQENGYGCDVNIKSAIANYEKSTAEGYPDSAHNLGLIYQGNSPATKPFRDIKQSLKYLEQGKEWGYAASANALGRLYLLMSKTPELAKEAGDPGSDKDEYIVTGIDYMEYAADNGDADAMLMLGLIFGSKDYGLYDMDKAQNYMELALVHGDTEAYVYLVRVLRAKMAARVALENENLENFSNLSVKDQEKLIRQLAKEAAPETIRHKQCSNTFCEKKEEKEGDFKKCGQCQRVSYCSRDCQKAHWKAGHKAVCTDKK